MNNSAWNLVSSFYCINLDKNPHRWAACIPEFLKVGINYVEQIVTHESEENRYLSFNQAHYDVIKKGYDTGKPFIIFEDDICFDDNWKRLEEASNQLPEDWDILYLGCNIIGVDTTEWQLPTKVSSNLFRLHNAWQSHSIIYSNKIAKWILDNFDPMTFPVYDEWLRVNVMNQGNVYVMNPMCCFQRKEYSDIWQREVDYSGAHLQGNNHLKRQ